METNNQSVKSKRPVKTIIIIACTLILIGFIFILIALIQAGFNTDELQISAHSYTHMEENIDIGNNDIKVDVITEDVIIEASETAENTYISYYDSDLFTHHITNSDDSLLVSVTEQKAKWYEYLTLDWGHKNTETLIRLPIDYKGNITLKTITGDVTLRDITGTQKVSINVVTGDIICANSTVSSIECSVITGDLRVDSIKCNDLELSSATGDIEFTSVVCENASVCSTTGDINFEMLDSQNITITVTTGDISGRLVGNKNDYTMKAYFGSGSSNLDFNTNGSRYFNVTVHTGDIHIDFER